MSETFAWAPIAPDWASPPNFIHDNGVRSRRQAVMAYMAEAHGRPGETVAQGWRRAYRRGWRIERVVIRRFGHPSSPLKQEQGHG